LNETVPDNTICVFFLGGEGREGEGRKAKGFNDVYGSELVEGLERRKQWYHAELLHRNIFPVALMNTK
jgi:hypothetical protein